MKEYYGRRVRIREYKYNGAERTYGCDGEYILKDTDRTGFLLKIDVADEHVMIEDEAGNIVKLSYKLVKFI